MKPKRLKLAKVIVLFFCCTLQADNSNENEAAPALQRSIEVSVDVSADILPADSDQWTLYVYATRPGTRLPLASYKGQLGDLPATIKLDESMYLLPDLTLKHTNEVIVIAKASQFADPHKKSPEDIIGYSGKISFQKNVNQQVKLTIDQLDRNKLTADKN